MTGRKNVYIASPTNPRFQRKLMPKVHVGKWWLSIALLPPSSSQPSNEMRREEEALQKLEMRLFQFFGGSRYRSRSYSPDLPKEPVPEPIPLLESVPNVESAPQYKTQFLDRYKYPTVRKKTEKYQC